MAARKARARRPQRRAGKQLRFTAALSLTRVESQRLEANAAADLRSLTNYVSLLVVEDLHRAYRTRRRSAAGAKPGKRRVTCDVAVQITAAEKEEAPNQGAGGDAQRLELRDEAGHRGSAQALRPASPRRHADPFTDWGSNPTQEG